MDLYRIWLVMPDGRSFQMIGSVRAIGLWLAEMLSAVGLPQYEQATIRDFTPWRPS